MKIMKDNETIIIQPDGKFNRNLYNIYNENTFVFILKNIYDELHPSIKSESYNMNEDLTVDEILNEKIMYCVIDSFNQQIINDTLKYAEQYKGSSIKYLIIKE